MGLQANEKYNQGKVDKLADYLRLYHEKGRPIDYEILIDGFRAVRRTNDPDMFSMFEEFITADTRSVEILFYTGTSNNNDKHIFFFGDHAKEGLSGVDIDSRVEEQFQKRIKASELDDLRKENEELESQVDELEKEVAQLEKEKLEMINSQSPLKGFLGEIGSSFVESFIRRNPNIVKSITGGEALSGLISNENKAPAENNSEGEVSFQAKTSQPSVTEDDKAAITFVNQLKSQFTRDDFDKIMVILQELSSNKSKIEAVLKDMSLQTTL